MSVYKFIFTGTPGVGKTTAIGTISELPPVVTEAGSSGGLVDVQVNQPAAMDFGEINLKGGQRVHLYGMPGQRRFKFMSDIIVQGGLGLIILVDNTRPDPMADLDIYLDNFEEFIKQTGAVIGLTRTEINATPTIEDYYEHLEKKGLTLPLFPVDLRKRDDVLVLLDGLMAMLEYG